LKYYICEGALQVGHKFSTSGKYTVIDGVEKDDYLAYIDGLPLNPEPEAFGLHENAEITTKQSQTIELLLDILKM
jgi:dynein heavy chain